MKQARMTFLAILGTMTLFVGSFSSASELILAGSTTVQRRIIEPANKAILENTGIQVFVFGVNSGHGFESLQEGKIRASISSSPLKLLLQGAGLADDGTYLEHVIWQDSILPIVNTTNPVSALSWQQLADINTGKILNWQEVGGPDLPITVITSQPTAATRIVFRKLVMKKRAYVKTAHEVASTWQEVDLVDKFKGGIGAVSAGFVSNRPGVVKVIETPEIVRPLSIITKGEPDADVQALINFLRSEEASKYFK